jgi:hypothetical protein
VSPRQVIVALHVETEADAEELAAFVRAEGLIAVIEAPELLDLPFAGGIVQKGWVVRVEGPPDAVHAFAARMKESMGNG